MPLEMERDPFESIFREHYRRVFGLLYRLTGQRAEAEDLTVETFMRYLKQPPEAGNTSGWLYRVAVRLGYNSLRAGKRRSHYEEKAVMHSLSQDVVRRPDEEAERARRQMKVREVLRQMPERDAQLLILHHSGFSYKEIAAALDVSSNSVGTLLCRAERGFEKLFLKGE